MSQKIKDAADLFAAEGEEACEILHGLKEQAQDALDVAVSEAPPEGDVLGRYRHFKERELPLIMRLEDPGERRAVLEDIARAHDLKVSDLRKALSAAEKRTEEAAAQENREGGSAQAEALAPERHERALRLLECQDILRRAAEAMERLGHVGEHDSKRLAFLCAISAKAGYPIQPSTHAQSSAGKNALWDATLSLPCCRRR